MKFPPFLLAGSLVAIIASSAIAQQPLDYKTAYQRAEKGDKPLLVLVTAEWCPPCQLMKKTTIPDLLKKQAFKDCHWASVDLDKEKTLAKQLIGQRGVPQLIIFEKRDGKWIRRYLRGFKTPQIVEAFVAQSPLIRTAEAPATTVGK